MLDNLDGIELSSRSSRTTSKRMIWLARPSPILLTSWTLAPTRNFEKSTITSKRCAGEIWMERCVSGVSNNPPSLPI